MMDRNHGDWQVRKIRSVEQAARELHARAAQSGRPAYLAVVEHPEGPYFLVLTQERVPEFWASEGFRLLRCAEPPRKTQPELHVVIQAPNHNASLGTMPPDQAHALLQILLGAEFLSDAPTDLGPPTDALRLDGPIEGYRVLRYPDRPEHLLVVCYTGGSASESGPAAGGDAGELEDEDEDDNLEPPEWTPEAIEEMSTPCGDAHHGPASLTLVLDHWEDQGFRHVRVHGSEGVQIDEYRASLSPEERQHVVVTHRLNENTVALLQAHEGGVRASILLERRYTSPPAEPSW